MQHILEGAGHNVIVAEDGTKALEVLIGRSDVQMLFSDINMPTMDGFSLLKQLRDRGSTCGCAGNREGNGGGRVFI
jgi:CheY-like chemotaxis protein